MRTSVLTLVRGRRAHLAHLMLSLAGQSRAPDELVIAWMQDAPFADLPEPGCPVRHVMVPGEPMPLAAARNRAAEAAAGELLVFLDVDCLASPGTVAAYEAGATAREGLFLGEVLYLPEGAVGEAPDVSGLDFPALDRLGQRHPAKPPVPAEGLREEADAGELWGLSFALPKARYQAVGGMDEAFVGYGGEETDFAARLAASSLPFFWTAGARCYHQHHRISVPPLQHFDHILRNAALFRARHGRWCMDYWLGQFHDRGLIDWRPADETLRLVRRPTPEEIAAAACGGERLFS
ncbi:glycosyl transferase family A [Aureimonas endophytica]|uniref:Glycosyl transferase family A n=1 Tax=Aureimonas endophytica TaxID=2027858 RepID=A0A917A242_9HYPH|nr:galactosyltransferase-related protein [Aureimonas endophytica]GGE22839.1 glycosyl transferase family A [Aureimonas endophytica]